MTLQSHKFMMVIYWVMFSLFSEPIYSTDRFLSLFSSDSSAPSDSPRATSHDDHEKKEPQTPPKLSSVAPNIGSSNPAETPLSFLVDLKTLLRDLENFERANSLNSWKVISHDIGGQYPVGPDARVLMALHYNFKTKDKNCCEDTGERVIKFPKYDKVLGVEALKLMAKEQNEAWKTPKKTSSKSYILEVFESSADKAKLKRQEEDRKEEVEREKAEAENSKVMKKYVPDMLLPYFIAQSNIRTQGSISAAEQSLITEFFSTFKEWWGQLPQEMNALGATFHLLLKSNAPAPLILNHLHQMIAQSLLLRLYPHYEQFWSKYLDWTTTGKSLARVIKRAFDEEDLLKGILENTELFSDIEVTIFRTMRSHVTTIFEAIKLPEDKVVLKTKVNRALSAAFNEAVIDSRSKVVPAKPPSKEAGREEGQPPSDGPDVPPLDEQEKEMKEVLRSTIVGVIQQAIRNTLWKPKIEQPTGWFSRSQQKNPGSDDADEEEQFIAVDLMEIAKRLDDLLLLTPTGRFSRSKTYTSDIRYITFALGLRDKWKIPLCGSKKVKQHDINPRKRWPQVGTAKKVPALEQTKAEHFQFPFPMRAVPRDIHFNRYGVIADIAKFREDSPLFPNPRPKGFDNLFKTVYQDKDKEKSKAGKVPYGKIVYSPARWVFDFLRIYCYDPGMKGSHVFSRMKRFFERYEKVSTFHQQLLESETEGKLRKYLDPERLTEKFFHKDKLILLTKFPVLQVPEPFLDWTSLVSYSDADLVFQTNPSSDDLKALENTFPFKRDLVEHVRKLLNLEKLSANSLAVDEMDNFDITQLSLDAKRLLLFQNRHQYHLDRKSLPQGEALNQFMNKVFGEKYNAIPRVGDALRRMYMRRQSNKPSHVDQTVLDDAAFLIKFFADLFQQTLIESFAKFSALPLTPENRLQMLADLKTMATGQPLSGPLPPPGSPGVKDKLSSSQEDHIGQGAGKGTPSIGVLHLSVHGDDVSPAQSAKPAGGTYKEAGA